MAYINKKDTDGNKALLQEGELGYDNYPDGGDVGRVYVGKGDENIPLAKKSEVDTAQTTADTHINRIDNPHSVTKLQVGLGNVDNTADIDKPVSTAQQSALNSKADKATTYTKTEIDTKLAEQDDASEINYDGAVSELVATNVQDAIDEVEDRLGAAEGAIVDVNLTRADKYLAAQNVVKMIYNPEGSLSKVRYNNDTDVDYEVLTYNTVGKLNNVAHYVEGALRGNTTLSYENGKLVAAPYTEV